MINLPKAFITPFRKAYEWLGDTFEFKNGQFIRNYGSRESDTGEVITEYGALQIIVLLRCVTLIAGAAASLPIDVGRRNKGTRELIENHPVEILLDSTPNPEMSSMDFRAHQWMSFLLWGNAFAHKVLDGDRLIALWPLMPCYMEVDRNAARDLIYKYTMPNQKTETYSEREILHVRWYSLDGIIGLNPIQMARNGIGIHRSTEKSVGKFFRNHGFTKMQMKFPAGLKQEQVTQTRKDFKENFGLASDGAYSVAIMPGGSELEPIGVNPSDAQFLEEREYNDLQICMLYGLPPHMVGLTDKQTSWGTGVESQKQGFLDFTMAPLLTAFEKAYERSLLAKGDRQTYVKHNTRAFLRADLAGRMAAYAIAVEKGINNRDEVRSFEDQNPIPGGGGQIFTVQSQLIPLDQVGKQPPVAQPPKPGG